MDLEARMAAVEAALGGAALASDGSSWPSGASDILGRIAALPVDPDVKALFTECARGILEAHMSMKATFLATMVHSASVSETDRALILELKESINGVDGTDVDALQRSFTAAQRFNEVITRAYTAALAGDLGTDAAALVPALRDALRAQ